MLKEFLKIRAQRESGRPRTVVGGPDWPSIQGQFRMLPCGVTYLNSGSEGSMPAVTLNSLRAASEDWASSPSYNFFNSPELGEDQKVNREYAAGFVGAAADDITLTDNTTMGLAMVLLGLKLQAGDEIIITNHEHPSLLSPLAILEDRVGIKVVRVDFDIPFTDADALVQRFKERITAKTRVFAFSHITWTTGARLPLKELCELAHEKKIAVLVDGAHGLGTVDLDLAETGVDFYACAGHKWLNGPPGTGLLYIRKACGNPWGLVPIISEQYENPDYSLSHQLQLRGCCNTTGFAAMVETMKFEDRIGRTNVQNRILELSAHAADRIIETWGPKALLSPSPDCANLRSGMNSFVPCEDPLKAKKEFIEHIVSTLWNKYKIYVRKIEVPRADCEDAIYAMRMSSNIFNDSSQADAMIERIKDIVKTT